MSTWKDYLSSLYFNPKSPASYSSPEKLYQYVKSEGKYTIGRHKIRKFLQSQEAYSLTRGARRKFSRSRVIVEGIDSLWDLDLMDMTDLSKDNDGNRYVLVAIDVFSRFGQVQPIKNKQGPEVVNAFNQMISGSRQPNTVRTDMGMEFRSKVFQKYLKTQDIHHYFALNTETKANYVERLIKTVKHKLYRYMMKQLSKRYIDVLDDVIHSYNNTIHRSIGATPESVNKDNEGEIRLQQYLLRTKHSKQTKPKKFKFKIGQTVRVSHIRSVFDREYSQKWSGEIFKVIARYRREGLPVYKLVDWEDETIHGTFYEHELQAIVVDQSMKYRIEKIIRKRTRNKKKEVLVRWLHWPKKYDSWIPEADVTSFT